ncbi:MAG: glycosyltransferase family 2 protein [Bacteroidota bacterium]|nr:glycosyltransferase family 2 protein [Bacteroidota bacterium]
MSISSPIISVIMPVFNAEKYLSEALDSVIRQSFKKWELICINDGSTDNSLDILTSYANKDKRIQVYSQENSGSSAGGRKTALNYINGEYTFSFDSDDYITPNLLENAHKRAQETNADIVIPDLHFVDSLLNTDTRDPIIGYNGNRNIVLSNMNAVKASLNWTISGLMLIKSNIIKQVGYTTNLMNEDEVTARKLFYFANKVAFCDGKYLYRHNDDSLSRKLSVKFFDTPFTSYNLYKFLQSKKCDKKIVDCQQGIAYLDFISKILFFKIKINCFSDNEKQLISERLKNIYLIWQEEKIKSSGITKRRILISFLKTLNFNRFEILQQKAIFIWKLNKLIRIKKQIF